MGEIIPFTPRTTEKPTSKPLIQFSEYLSPLQTNRIVAEEFTTRCQDLDDSVEHPTTEAERQQYYLARDKKLQELKSLVPKMQTTQYGQHAVLNDIDRCNNGTSIITFTNLTDILHIDLDELKYTESTFGLGVFGIEGAKKYEERQLTVYLPMAIREAQQRHTISEIERLSLEHTAWTRAFQKHYDLTDDQIHFQRFDASQQRATLYSPTTRFPFKRVTT